METKEYLTTQELTERLKVTRQAIYKWRNAGMPYEKFGKAVRFDYAAVLHWLRNYKGQAN